DVLPGRVDDLVPPEPGRTGGGGDLLLLGPGQSMEERDACDAQVVLVDGQPPPSGGHPCAGAGCGRHATTSSGASMPAGPSSPPSAPRGAGARGRVHTGRTRPEEDP